MPTFSVRCRNSTCRHRRVSSKHPDDYKRVPRCPICWERKGWRLEQRQYSKRDRCTCSGYHFTHQKGSPCCDFHPRGAYNQAKRAGVPDDDIPLEHLGQPMDNDDECPF